MAEPDNYDDEVSFTFLYHFGLLYYMKIKFYVN